MCALKQLSLGHTRTPVHTHSLTLCSLVFVKNCCCLLVPLNCQLACEMMPTAETPSVTQKWFIALITRTLQALTDYGRVWHITAFSGNSHHFFLLRTLSVLLLDSKISGLRGWGWRKTAWIVVKILLAVTPNKPEFMVGLGSFYISWLRMSL